MVIRLEWFSHSAHAPFNEGSISFHRDSFYVINIDYRIIPLSARALAAVRATILIGSLGQGPTWRLSVSSIPTEDRVTGA